MSLTKIGSIGINTGIQFAGVTTVSTLHVGSGVTLSSDGDIFATGISTFSEDIKVGSGVTISPDGDGFYTGVVTATTFSGALAASSLTGALPAISGANLTNLDASDLASGTVPTARLGSGTASSSTFLRGDSTFQTVNTDLVGDTSPQLGGNLDVNTKNILFGDSSDGSSDDVLIFGAGSDLKIYHDPNENVIESTSAGDFKIKTDSTINITKASSEDIAKFIPDGAVELYHDNSKRIETKGAGANFYGDTGDHTVVTIYGSEGRDADLELFADDGDDNADKWRILASTDASFYIQNYTSGSWEFNLKATGNGAVELYHDNTKRFETASYGVKTSGEIEIASGHLRGDSTNGLRMFSDSTATTGITLTTDDDLVPQTDNAQDLGTSSLRWRNLYTTDLQLSNEGKTNDVDGTWGDYTIQEGESDLFLINNRSGKKYKFNLTEVS